MQFASNFDKLMLPSPEAAKATRLADFPVSHSTGTADIGIDLYSIVCGSLRHDLSLKYDTSGVKVEDVSGPVGLGWRLNAGGVITRSICGRPDEAADQEYIGPNATAADSNGQLSPAQAYRMLALVNGQFYDTQYDIYSYNFCGYSGSFFIDNQGKVMKLTPSELEIIREGILFRIKDAVGAEYVFSETEQTYKLVGSSSPQAPVTQMITQYPWTNITSWHLTSISSMNGKDSIRFEYQSLQNVNTTRYSYHRSYQLMYRYLGNNSYAWRTDNNMNNVPTFEMGQTPIISYSSWAYQTDNTYFPKAISRIFFSGGVLEFDYESIFLHGGRSYNDRLSSITVRNAHEEVVKTIELELALQDTSSGTAFTRSLLRKVIIKGSDGVQTESYTMAYYDEGTNVLKQACDLFGYYNGAISNTTKIPFNLFPTQDPVNESAANRNYNFEKARTLALESITTAAGARTRIVYEANSVAGQSGSIFSTIGIGIRVGSITTYDVKSDGSERAVKTRTFAYENAVLSIPSMYFTANRFITASEYNFCDTGTAQGVYCGYTSPIRSCTITIADQSVCPGAPLESAIIMYGKVTETVSDSSDASKCYSIEYTFSTESCMNDPVSSGYSLDSSHDDNYIASGNIASYHFLQRIPPVITRYNAPPSVTLTHPQCYFRETNRAILSSPLTVRKYTANHVMYEETRNTYVSNYDNMIIGNAVKDMISRTAGGGNNPMRCVCDYQQAELLYKRMYCVLSKSVHKNCLDEGEFTITTEYKYDSSVVPENSPYFYFPQNCYILSPKEVTTKVSGSPYTYIRQTQYAKDLRDNNRQPYEELYNLNYKQPVIEEISVKDENGNQLSSRKKEMLFTVLPDGRVLPSGEEICKDGEQSGPCVRITAFDTVGNPSQIEEDDKPVRSCIWSYGGKLPVIEVSGARISEIVDAIGTTAIDNLMHLGEADVDDNGTVIYSQSSASAIATSIKNVAESIKTAFMLNATVHVNTVTYKGLVGADSITDPAGRKTVYAYDTAGRLSNISLLVDNNLMIGAIEGYAYSFNQNEGGSNNIIHRVFTSSIGRASSARTDISYYDGLGRTLQQVQVKGAGTGSSALDIIQPMAPDYMGREDAIEYLPYSEATNNGSFRSDAISAQQSFYNGLYTSGVAASARKKYENSDRNRALESFLPGFTAEKTLFATSLSGANEVLDLSYSAGTVTKAGFHPAGRFRVERTTGADGAITELFLNDLGSPVLERKLVSGSGSSAVWTNTAYIRDAHDRVICVVTPNEYEKLRSGQNTVTDAHCYTYSYDSRDRVTSKKLPDAAAVSYTYLGNSSLVVTETVGLRVYTYEYDALLRLVRKKYSYNGSTAIKLAEYRYDEYRTLISAGYAFASRSGVVTSHSNLTKGLKTYEKIRILEPTETESTMASDSNASFLERVYYYDDRGRCVQCKELYPGGSWHRVSTKYAYTGEVTVQADECYVNGVTLDSTFTYSYDSRGRKTSLIVTHGGKTAEVNYSYDSLGRLSSTVLGGSSAVATLADSYTVQGWLKQRTSSQFSSFLYYDAPLHASVTSAPGLAGNITEWRTVRGSQTSSLAFSYDKMSRLTGASRFNGTSNVSLPVNIEKDITYDANGNITTLKRYGASGNNPQQLSFSYDGNKRIADSYDQYGNLIADSTAGTSLAWSIAGMPRTITTGSTVGRYSFAADGTKYKLSDGSTELIYMGSMVIRKQNNVTSLDILNFGDGVIRKSGSDLEVNYYIKDHLGSIRTVLDASGTILSQHDYYPFGKEITASGSSAASQRYTFSGKENQATTPAQAPYLDFGARMYSADSVRWLSHDPLAEKYYSVTPYSYCAGNPVNLVDTDGERILFASGVSKEFKKSFAETVKYMNSKKTSDGLAKLEASENIYYIDCRQGSTSGFLPETRTIYWDNAHITKSGNMWKSPATSLDHEVAHALHYDEALKNKDSMAKFSSRINTKVAEYDNLEEKDVIENREQSTARKHGEIRNDQVTRKNHSGSIINVDISSLSPEELEKKIRENNEMF